MSSEIEREVLIVGDWQFTNYEESIAHALQVIGHSAHRLSYDYTWRLRSDVAHYYVDRLWSRRAERLLVEAVSKRKFDVVLVWRGEPIMAHALQKAREQAAGNPVWLYHSNDDIFSNEASARWRHVREALPLYDGALVYRPWELNRYLAFGVKAASLWLPSYDVRHFLPSQDPLEEREFDLVFVGHFEDDGRRQLLAELSQAGLRVGIWGDGWPRIAGVDHRPPVREADYAQALCKGRIALAVYSTANRDTFTRRCFEIPATRTPMLAARTDIMAKWFRNGVEALLFDSLDHAVALATSQSSDSDQLERIRKASYERLQALRASSIDRARELMSFAGHQVGGRARERGG